MIALARRRALGALLAAALALGACGPYAPLAQKLDITERIVGDTWIAAGANRSEIRTLLLGRPDASGTAEFAFTSIPGVSVTTLQGTWHEYGAAGETSLRIERTFKLPDERSVSPLRRKGTIPDSSGRTVAGTVSRSGRQLVVSAHDDGPGGSGADLSGTYVLLPEALTHLGVAAHVDAACAYQVASLGIQSSEGRIPGFGGGGMSTYLRQTGWFVGTVAGDVSVKVDGSITGNSTTTIHYYGFSDQNGIVLDGEQLTYADAGGNGYMAHVVGFRFSPIDPTSATTPAPLTGSIDYGAGSDAVHISNGNPVGGYYVTSLVGGRTARVPATQVTSPDQVATCLALP